ncbi:MAG: bifunctional diaminohydroxyphosphoribosylaminopyrimidine deaminase/5-amino-6-(5-phosphoribosylamino)uracil reductase RibD [Bacteroidota bacterium]
MENHKLYMKRCLELASMGMGNVAPNPMVGCVLVKDGKIIGEGYHRVYGEPHAEVNAIRSVKDPNEFKDSTIYVSLEPCSHYGKTPPCADLIINSRIPRVVIAQKDPNPLVAGNGIKKLREAGIEVIEGVLETEAKEINRRFNVFHQEKRPFIILKWAMTADGYMDTVHKTENRGVFWISSPETKKLVHKWRAEEDAIMIGKKTLEVDNPSLDTRDYFGSDPLRVILSGKGELDNTSKVFNDKKKTLVIGDHNINFDSDLVEMAAPNFDDFIGSTLKELYDRKIMSVIVEGGAFTLQRHLESRIWDEARVIQSNNTLGGGLSAPQISFQPETVSQFGRDRIYYYRNR